MPAIEKTRLDMQRRLVRIANAVLDLEPYRPRTGGAQAEGHCPGISSLDRGEYVMEPSPAAINAIRDFLGRRPISWYPDPDASELRTRLSEYVSLPQDYISCYAGSRLAIEHVFRTYLEAGTEMVISGPVVHSIRVAVRCTGARTIEVEYSDQFNPLIENLVNSITPRTRAIYVGNPNEITGTVFGEAELVFLLAYAERTMIIVDEEYFEFSGRSIADLVARFPNLTVVRSLSKGFGLTSLKAGYILTDPGNLQFIHRIKGENGPDAVAQIAALAALENLDCTREYVADIHQSKKMLGNSLPEIGYQFRMTPADFILLKVADSVYAANFLKSENIQALDLSFANSLKGFLRISIGTPKQTDILLLALSRSAERLATGLNRNRIVEQPGRTKKKSKIPVSAT